MNIEDQIAVGIPVWRKMVEDAGGQWVGVQMPFFMGTTGTAAFAPEEPLAMFLPPVGVNPVTLPISQMTEENVKAKLGIKSVAKKTQVKLTRLDELVAKLRGTLDAAEVLAAQIEEEIKNV